MAKYEREHWQEEARQRRSKKKGGEEMKERKNKGGKLKMPLNRDLNLTLHYDHTPRESPIRIGAQKTSSPGGRGDHLGSHIAKGPRGIQGEAGIEKCNKVSLYG